MIARKSFLIITSNFFNQILAWIGFITLAKLWGDFAPEALGIIGFAMAFLSLFNYIADLGFGSAHIKRISEGKDLGTCIGTYATIKLILTGIMITVIFAAIFIWKNILHNDFYDATTESAVIVLIFYYVFVNLQSIAIATLQGKRKIAKREITIITENIVKTPLTILIALAGVAIAGKVSIPPAISWPPFLQPLQQFLANHAVGSLAMTYVFGMMATFFIGMWFLRKYPWKKPSRELNKSYFLFALPAMLISTIRVISTNIDKLMIGYFWTATEVGYYFSVQRISGILTIFVTAVSVVLFPMLSEYHSFKNFKGLKRTARLAERYISMVLIPPMVVVIIFVKPLINIVLSGVFLPGAPVLIALTIYTFVTGLSMPYFSLIGGINRPGIAAKIGVVVCVTNILFNYLFIPKAGLLSSFGINGATGAAIATILSASVGFFGLRFAAKRLTEIKLLQSHTPRHIIAGLVMALVLYLIVYQTPFFPVVQWYHLIAFAGTGLIIYIGVLYVLKEFKKEDMLFFLNILHPKEMIDYVKSELKEK